MIAGLKYLRSGDEVAFAKEFLRGIGANDGELAVARGIVRNILFFGPEVHIARVDRWTVSYLPNEVIVSILRRVPDRHRRIEPDTTGPDEQAVDALSQ